MAISIVRAGLLVLALLVAGCAGIEGQQARQAVQYRCAGGESFRASVADGTARLRFEGGEESELKRVPSASGAKFTDGKSTLWIKGAEAYVERADSSSSFGCRAAP